MAINIFKSHHTREPIRDDPEPIQSTCTHGYVPLEASDTKICISQGSTREVKLSSDIYKGSYYRNMTLTNFGSWLNSPCEAVAYVSNTGA